MFPYLIIGIASLTCLVKSRVCEKGKVFLLLGCSAQCWVGSLSTQGTLVGFLARAVVEAQNTVEGQHPRHPRSAARAAAGSAGTGSIRPTRPDLPGARDRARDTSYAVEGRDGVCRIGWLVLRQNAVEHTQRVHGSDGGPELRDRHPERLATLKVPVEEIGTVDGALIRVQAPLPDIERGWARGSPRFTPGGAAADTREDGQRHAANNERCADTDPSGARPSTLAGYRPGPSCVASGACAAPSHHKGSVSSADSGRQRADEVATCLACWYLFLG